MSDDNDEKHVVPDFDKYPVHVTLCFKSKAARDHFMGGLSDGFGESWCDLHFEYWWTERGKPCRGFDEAKQFTVDVQRHEDEPGEVV